MQKFNKLPLIASICKLQSTMRYVLAMVPSRAVFRSGCTCVADLRVQCAIFVEETAVDCLIKSVPLAGWPLLANADAVLQM